MDIEHFESYQDWTIAIKTYALREAGRYAATASLNRRLSADDFPQIRYELHSKAMAGDSSFNSPKNAMRSIIVDARDWIDSQTNNNKVGSRSGSD